MTTTNKTVEQIVPGDIVTLKSKGPVMTVLSSAVGDVTVAWFIPSGMVQSAKFPAAAVEKFIAPEPKPAGETPAV